MKIAFLITRADSIGGAQVYVRNLAERYRSEGKEVVIIAGTGGKLCEWSDAVGIPFFRLRFLKHAINPFYDIVSVFELARLIRRIAPDIVSISSSKAGIVGRLASAMARVPAVLTVHGWSFTEGIRPGRKRFFKGLERVLRIFTRQVIVISEFDRKLALMHNILPPDRIKHIYNGVPGISQQKSVAPDPAEELVLVMVARHDTPKDQQLLIRAVAGIDKVKLILVGDGPLFQQNIEFAAAIGASEKVSFLGYRQNVSEILLGAHVFVLISDYEGFPLSTLEAMSCGLPVIVSDVCGAGEAVEQKLNGFKIPKGDIQSLLEAIKYFKDKPGQIAEMGRQSRRLFQEKFTFDQMFNETDGLYRQIVGCTQ